MHRQGALRRVVDLDELVRQSQLRSHMRRHRRGTIPLGSVVARSDETHAHFPRKVRLGL